MDRVSRAPPSTYRLSQGTQGGGFGFPHAAPSDGLVYLGKVKDSNRVPSLSNEEPRG